VKTGEQKSVQIGFKFDPHSKTDNPVSASLTVPKLGYKKQLVLFNKVNTLK
jgi:hypothetical protein